MLKPIAAVIAAAMLAAPLAARKTCASGSPRIPMCSIPFARTFVRRIVFASLWTSWSTSTRT